MFHSFPPGRDRPAELRKRELLRKEQAALLADREEQLAHCVAWAREDERKWVQLDEKKCAGAEQANLAYAAKKATEKRVAAAFLQDADTRAHGSLKRQAMRREHDARTAEAVLAADLEKFHEAACARRGKAKLAQEASDFLKSQAGVDAARQEAYNTAEATRAAAKPAHAFEDRPKPPPTAKELRQEAFLSGQGHAMAQRECGQQSFEDDLHTVYAAEKQRVYEASRGARRAAAAADARALAKANADAAAAAFARRTGQRQSDKEYRQRLVEEVAAQDRMDGLRATERARERAGHYRELTRLVAERREQAAVEKARAAEVERREADAATERAQIVEEQKVALQKQYEALMRTRPRAAGARMR
eukprot:TRINITY_DN33266_c0_g1_i1.p1 TRINITY_DN33266_c0_g1~~TRINITY_DN33266_c0_g1_i1.p1  ORF type:complete len:362 (+),score=110.94 TRINITY_DN33266_c0_g1_i1:93-1178(+)